MFVSFTRIDDVKAFVEHANECSQDMILSSGNYRVDAKSILGVFSLNLDKPVELIIEGDEHAEDVQTFLQDIASFIVTDK